jgi:hypothetical protein
VFSSDEQEAGLNSESLLQSALRHLSDAGLHVTELGGGDDDGADALLEIAGPVGAARYEVQVKSRVSPGSAAAIPRPDRGRLLVVTGHVPEPVGQAWRSQDVHYVDAAGNMYLRWDGVLLDVRGRPRPSAPRPAQPGQPLRSFGPTGLKVLFALLVEQDLAAATYRDIAEVAHASLGTVQWVFKELEALGHLSSGPPARRLHRVPDLFNRWVEAYVLNLSPRLSMARFDVPDPSWWSHADDALRAEHAQWGGETAAHRLNPHLRPARAVIYASRVPKRLAIDYHFFRTDGPGSVEIRERFWHLREDPPELTVPTPLVYADLVASADPRQLEAAADLREHDALLRRLDRR